jgi:RES domain-containing protein
VVRSSAGHSVIGPSGVVAQSNEAMALVIVSSRVTRLLWITAAQTAMGEFRLLFKTVTPAGFYPDGRLPPQEV